MSKVFADVRRFGPLAEVERLSDEIARHLVPMSDWYPDLSCAFSKFEAAILWEIGRLRWEVEFAEKVREDERKAARRARGRARRGVAVQAAGSAEVRA